jgi:hypothetical protein
VKSEGTTEVNGPDGEGTREVKNERSQAEALKLPEVPLVLDPRDPYFRVWFTHNSGGGDGGGGSAQI